MTIVRVRLHEQREFPNACLTVFLKKNTFIEELNWNKKTEKTIIYSRFLLKDWNWVFKGKKKFLRLVFQKVNLKSVRKRKLRLIEKILASQYEVLVYSLFKSILNSTVHKLESYPAKNAEKFVKHFSKEVVNLITKRKIVEKEV